MSGRQPRAARCWPLPARLLLCAVAAAALHGSAWAVFKCTENGKTTFQQLPCANAAETVGDELRRREHNEVIHKRLDQLSAQLQGGALVPPPVLPTLPPAKDDDDDDAAAKVSTAPRTAASAAAAAAAASAAREAQEAQLKTSAANPAAGSGITQYLASAKRVCGGALAEVPKVGITEDRYRKCTMLGLTVLNVRMVELPDKDEPARLYTYMDGNPKRRVYVIKGVVTAIKP